MLFFLQANSFWVTFNYYFNQVFKKYLKYFLSFCYFNLIKYFFANE